MTDDRILFFGKKEDENCLRAADFIRRNFSAAQIYLGAKGEPFPEQAEQWQGDYIISYLTPWVIPGAVLAAAEKAAINFHPGNTDYPGIGCTNFAIYNGAETFGITCHHMEAAVDTGAIIVEKNFALFDSDSVYSLTRRCYAHIESLFYDIVSMLMAAQPLPVSSAKWKRRPYTRKELNALCRLTVNMTPEEIEKRVRAMAFPGAPGAYFDINGKKYEVQRAE